MICCLYASQKLTDAKLWTNKHVKEEKREGEKKEAA